MDDPIFGERERTGDEVEVQVPRVGDDVGLELGGFLRRDGENALGGGGRTHGALAVLHVRAAHGLSQLTAGVLARGLLDLFHRLQAHSVLNSPEKTAATH
jgi:hypothetical protein